MSAFRPNAFLCAAVAGDGGLSDASFIFENFAVCCARG